MNNYRLSTFVHEDKVEIPQSLIQAVLKMKDVYIRGEDGLRVKSSNGALVNGQVFYLLAEGSNGGNLIFKNSEPCANYFGVTAPTINNRISKKLPISGGVLMFR